VSAHHWHRVDRVSTVSILAGMGLGEETGGRGEGEEVGGGGEEGTTVLSIVGGAVVRCIMGGVRLICIVWMWEGREDGRWEILVEYSSSGSGWRVRDGDWRGCYVWMECGEGGESGLWGKWVTEG